MKQILDDPENIEAFQTLAQKKSDIDFETYTLDANDRLYQQNVSSLENTQSFATMFLIVVIGAGSAILCLILILTIRSRYYEIGVFLSLGQSKVKIILQQLFEMLLIAAVAFVISLGTGKLVSNVVGNMLESGTKFKCRCRKSEIKITIAITLIRHPVMIKCSIKHLMDRKIQN